MLSQVCIICVRQIRVYSVPTVLKMGSEPSTTFLVDFQEMVKSATGAYI